MYIGQARGLYIKRPGVKINVCGIESFPLCLLVLLLINLETCKTPRVIVHISIMDTAKFM